MIPVYFSIFAKTKQKKNDPRGIRTPEPTLLFRPFLTQSDSASRKRPFSTGLFFDWIFLVPLLVVSRVDLIVFVVLLEAVGCEGVLLERCMAVENRLAALSAVLRAFCCASNACCARE